MAAVDIHEVIKNPKLMLVVIVGAVGGIYLASRMKGKPKEDSEPAPQQVIYSQAPVTDMGDEEELEELRRQLADLKYRQDNKGNPPPGKPPVPPAKLPPPAPQPPKSTPPKPPNPGPLPRPTDPHPCPKGQHWDFMRGRCVPDKVAPPLPPKPAPKPAPQPQAPEVPGNYPTTCQGVGPLAPENPRTYTPDAINRFTDAYIRAGHSEHIAWQRSLNMAVGGSTGKANLRSLRYDYIPNRAKQATYNAIRRSHGLKALTNAQYDQMQADFDKEIAAHGSRDAFSKEFVYQMFAKWHVPFVCGG